MEVACLTSWPPSAIPGYGGRCSANVIAGVAGDPLNRKHEVDLARCLRHISDFHQWRTTPDWLKFPDNDNSIDQGYLIQVSQEIN